MVDPAVDATVRASVALLFTAAAAHKLRDGPGFRAVVDAYRVVPGWLVTVTSGAVVAAELAIACALVASRAVGLLGAAALLLVYAAALAVNLLRGRRDLDCGCVGFAGREGISWWLVGRNVVLAGVAVGSSGVVAARPLLWVDGVTILGAVAASLALYVAVDGLVAELPALARVRGDA